MSISAEELFRLVNMFILPAWLMLMFAPQWKWTNKLVLSGYYTIAFSLIYLFLIVFNFDVNNFNFNTLENVKHIFTNDYFLLAGWVHYLAFDLLIGACIVKDAKENNIQSVFLFPLLAFTFYLGPIGYLSYQIYKHGIEKKRSLNITKKGLG